MLLFTAYGELRIGLVLIELRLHLDSVFIIRIVLRVCDGRVGNRQIHNLSLRVGSSPTVNNYVIINIGNGYTECLGLRSQHTIDMMWICTHGRVGGSLRLSSTLQHKENRVYDFTYVVVSN
jgi:hypothetical protein